MSFDNAETAGRRAVLRAGRRAGCRTIFIDRSNSEHRQDPHPDHVARDLGKAATWILSHGPTGE